MGYILYGLYLIWVISYMGYILYGLYLIVIYMTLRCYEKCYSFTILLVCLLGPYYVLDTK